MQEIYLSPSDVQPHIHDAASRINSYSSERIGELMDASLHSHTLINDEVVQYGLIENGSDLDTSKLIVMPHPYGNGWAPHMLLRGMMLQKSLDANHPVVALPSHSFRFSPYSLSDTELFRVIRGDLNPVAQRHAAIIEHVQHRYKTDSVAMIDGYSQAAATGAVLAKEIETAAAFFAEAPNAAYRANGDPKQERKLLNKAFTGGGLGPLNRAIHDTGIASLNEAQGLSRNGKTTARQLAGMALFGAGTLHPVNRVLKQGFTVPTFSQDVMAFHEAQPEARIVVARAAGSLIMTQGQLEYVAQALDGADNISYMVLEGTEQGDYGHAAGDNLLLHAQAFVDTVSS